MRGELERAKVHEGEGTGGCTVLHAEQLDKRALGEGREYSRTEAAKREKKGEGEGGGCFRCQCRASVLHVSFQSHTDLPFIAGNKAYASCL